MSLLPWLLRWPVPPDRTTFAAGLHAGSALGIGLALRAELRTLDRRTTVLLAVTSVPAAVVGLFAQPAVERRLGRPGPTAALLAAAGLALWAADTRPEQVRRVGARQAGAAALAQVAALAPGVSRLGASMTALRLTGVHRDEAQRFSLLMSLPVTAGAAALTLTRSGRHGLVAPVFVGAPVAALVGGLVASRRAAVSGLSAAAVYRLAVAAAVGVRLWSQREEKA